MVEEAAASLEDAARTVEAAAGAAGTVEGPAGTVEGEAGTVTWSTAAPAASGARRCSRLRSREGRSSGNARMPTCRHATAALVAIMAMVANEDARASAVPPYCTAIHATGAVTSSDAHAQVAAARARPVMVNTTGAVLTVANTTLPATRISTMDDASRKPGP